MPFQATTTYYLQPMESFFILPLLTMEKVIDMRKALIIIGMLFAVSMLAACSQQDEDHGDFSDVECGELPEDMQSECCEKKHEGEPRIQCVGSWQYVNGACKFECE